MRQFLPLAAAALIVGCGEQEPKAPNPIEPSATTEAASPAAALSPTETSPASKQEAQGADPEAGRVLQNAANLLGASALVEHKTTQYRGFNSHNDDGSVTGNFVVNLSKHRINMDRFVRNANFLQSWSGRFGVASTVVITPAQERKTVSYQVVPERPPQRTFLFVDNDEPLPNPALKQMDTQTVTYTFPNGSSPGETLSIIRVDPRKNKIMPKVTETDFHTATELSQAFLEVVVPGKAPTSGEAQIMNEAVPNGISKAMASKQNGASLQTVRKVYFPRVVKRGGFTAPYILPPKVFFDAIPDK